MAKRTLVTLAALAVMPAAAMAQWSDNFDSYPSNTNINGQGGWQGWGAVAAQAPNTSTAHALSGPNSVLVAGQGDTGGAGYSDNVHKYTGYTSGWWEYTANIYVPGNATGQAYFILLNQYADPSGPFNWSIEYKIDAGPSGATANTFSDDYTNGTSAVSGTGNARFGTNKTLIRDAWVQIRVDFDLTSNVMQAWYNGVPVSGGSWKTNATSTLALAATDLYSGTSSGVYFDSLSLAQIPAPSNVALLGLGGLVAARRRRA